MNQLFIYSVILYRQFKGALFHFGEDVLTRRERSILTDFIFYAKTNEINKLTLKDNTVSYCFTLFTCGGPCHLSSFKTVFWTLFFFLSFC